MSSASWWTALHPRRWGLVTRIMVLTLGLLVLVQVMVLSVVRHSIGNSVRLNLGRELEADARVWQRLMDQNAQQLRLGTSVLVADFGFRAAVSSGDGDTIESALENHGARIGATVTVFLDNDFVVQGLGSANRNDVLAQTLAPIARRLANAPQRTEMALVNGRLHQFVVSPVRAPLPLGWVMMGFTVDESLAKDMAAVSGVEVVLTQQQPTTQPQVLYSTLPQGANAVLAAQAQNQPAVQVAEQTYYFRPVVLPVADLQAQAVLLRATSAAEAPLNDMQTVLLGIDAAGLVLFALGSVLLARRVSKPLELLVAETERLGQGDYSQPVKDPGSEDEVGELARAFDRMRLNIQANQAEIRQLAYWDRLTGLPNRAQLRAKLQQALKQAQTDGTETAVIMLDLDRLKHINDVLGYTFGDRVLQSTAQRLKDLAEYKGGLAARMAGGEFAVLLPQCGPERALEVARLIVTSFEQPVAFDNQTVDLSAGMGVACAPLHAQDADVLLSRAEVAMYAAKRKTMGTQLYDAALDTGSQLTLSLLSELRQALDQGELRLFLQPKVALHDQAVVAAEALVRWQHPIRGMVPPLQFIPFAEQTGFVRHLTLWMLDEVAHHWARLQTPGQAVRVAINLSTRDLMDQEFPAKLDAILARHQVPRSGLCLEITESAIMDDPERAEATLVLLSSQGYKLSIDDFGTGYSSLAYLKRLPVDELKIDKSFVMGMAHDESDAKIVRSTIDLAHNLGLSVVAEGVENAALLQLLAQLSCDEAQGYHISRPIPADDFVAWRAGWQAQTAAATGTDTHHTHHTPQDPTGA